MVAFLARRYAEVVDVFRADDAPERFVWRGRHYIVRDILAHWVRTGAWWEQSEVRRMVVGDESTDRPPSELGLELQQLPATPRWGQRAWGEPAPDVGVSVDAEVDDDEREFWRVEASVGRSTTVVVLELCFAWSSGRWTVESVMD